MLDFLKSSDNYAYINVIQYIDHQPFSMKDSVPRFAIIWTKL